MKISIKVNVASTAFDGYLQKEDVLTVMTKMRLMSPKISPLEYLAKVRARQVYVQFVFPLFFKSYAAVAPCDAGI